MHKWMKEQSSNIQTGPQSKTHVQKWREENIQTELMKRIKSINSTEFINLLCLN